MAIAKIEFKKGCSYTLNTTNLVKPEFTASECASCKWLFSGTYSNAVFDDNGKAGVYGFASKSRTVDGDSVSVGQFVKAKSGASVPPMRAYLKYVATPTAQSKPSPDGDASVVSISEEELPEYLTVKFIDQDDAGNEEITAIVQLDSRTGEISMDENLWFDMKGRKLDRKPTAKGTYFNKGQKVVVK